MKMLREKERNNEVAIGDKSLERYRLSLSHLL